MSRILASIFLTTVLPITASAAKQTYSLSTGYSTPGSNQPNNPVAVNGSTPQKTGVPGAFGTGGGPKGIERLRQNKNNVAAMFSALKAQIYGQDNALERIAAQYGETQKNHTGKPKVLVAMGPSGGGKTFTATKLAERLFNGKVLEISGSEFRSHAGSLENTKLFGSIGQGGSEGSLVKFARENPQGFAFVINEGEKMNPDIWLMLMEFLDQGKISNREGKQFQVSNLWVIITSNRGNRRMFPPTSKNWTQAEVDKHLRGFKQPELQSYFMQQDGLADKFQLPDEIIKRIDEFIAFGPTTRDAAIMMAKGAADSLNKEYKKEFSVTLNFDEKAIDDVATTAWSSSNDARTVNRRVRALMSQMLDESVDGLQLKGNEVLDITMNTDSIGHKHYQVSANGHSISIAAERNIMENPLLDPELRERLRNMQQLMGQIVVGQDEAIADISDAVVSHYGRGKPTRPFSAYLIGPSGNGKTEMGRALAKVIYGDQKRYAVIPMGNVANEDDFGTIFGSSAKFQGGDVERAFEKVLRENPNGAVILLDEISNMGGGDPRRKAALFQKLYDLFEEGRYVSPIDGREYDVTKYQFILTGNDGEQLFRGITSDDLLLTTWKNNKGLESVRETMREASIPNAFINRLNVVALTKPLLKSEVGMVTEKLWIRQVDEFMKINPGIDIRPAPNMMSQLAKTFFTADQGGRSVRKILEDKVGALLTYALLKTDANFADLSGYQVVVDLEDTAGTKAYNRSGQDRQVLFVAQVMKNGQLIHTEKLDVTDISPLRVAQSQSDARATAYHEAGHAVANQEEISQERMGFITIRGGSTGKLRYLGYARYEPLDANGTSNMTRERVVARLARLWAGSKAQQMAGYPVDSGWSEDLRMINLLASKALTTWGLDPDLMGFPVDKDGNALISGPKADLYHRHLQQLIREGEVMAEKLLVQRWKMVRAVTAELLLRGEIKRDTFVRLQSENAAAPVTTLSARQSYKDAALTVRNCRAVFN